MGGRGTAAVRNSNNSSFGEPGVYTLYRSGKVNFKSDDYPVFFAREERYAQEYAYDKNGKVREFGEYQMNIKNPLVINLKATDASELYTNVENGQYFIHNEQAGPITATNQLFGTNFDYQRRAVGRDVDAFLNYATTKAGRAKAQQARDQAIMTEAIKRGYDAVIYKFDKPMNFQGGVKLNNSRSKEEVMIPAGNLKRLRRKR